MSGDRNISFGMRSVNAYLSYSSSDGEDWWDSDARFSYRVWQHPKLEAFLPVVRKRVEYLKELQSQHDELETKFLEEKTALEAKYQKLYESLYTKRYEVVNGLVEVEGNKDEAVQERNEAFKVKGIPYFWLHALKGNDILHDEIAERDEEALTYLKDIKWCRLDDVKGFKMEFFFDANPYFKNTVLTKTYHQIIGEDDKLVVLKAMGTEIEWNPGKCLTEKLSKKRPRKGLKNTKPITIIKKRFSFFNFFSPPQAPKEEDESEDFEGYRYRLERDFESGSTIQDKIIPHAVSWLLGEVPKALDVEYDEDIDWDEDDEYDEEEEEESN